MLLKVWFYLNIVRSLNFKTNNVKVSSYCEFFNWITEVKLSDFQWNVLTKKHEKMFKMSCTSLMVETTNEMTTFSWRWERKFFSCFKRYFIGCGKFKSFIVLHVWIIVRYFSRTLQMVLISRLEDRVFSD